MDNSLSKNLSYFDYRVMQKETKLIDDNPRLVNYLIKKISSESKEMQPHDAVKYLYGCKLMLQIVCDSSYHSAFGIPESAYLQKNKEIYKNLLSLVPITYISTFEKMKTPPSYYNLSFYNKNQPQYSQSARDLSHRLQLLIADNASKLSVQPLMDQIKTAVDQKDYIAAIKYLRGCALVLKQAHINANPTIDYEPIEFEDKKFEDKKFEDKYLIAQILQEYLIEFELIAHRAPPIKTHSLQYSTLGQELLNYLQELIINTNAKYPDNPDPLWKEIQSDIKDMSPIDSIKYLRYCLYLLKIIYLRSNSVVSQNYNLINQEDRKIIARISNKYFTAFELMAQFTIHSHAYFRTYGIKDKALRYSSSAYSFLSYLKELIKDKTDLSLGDTLENIIAYELENKEPAQVIEYLSVCELLLEIAQINANPELFHKKPISTNLHNKELVDEISKIHLVDFELVSLVEIGYREFIEQDSFEYSELTNGLRAFFDKRFHEAAIAMQKSEMEKYLKNCGLDAAQCNQIITYLRSENVASLRCDARRPFSLTGLTATCLPSSSGCKDLLKHFNVMSIRNGNLEIIYINGFEGLSHLVEIRLNNNKINKIEEDFFTKFDKLKLVDLSTNNLSSFDFGEFANSDEKYARGPITIDLSHNQITNINLEQIAKINIQSINLQNNYLSEFKITNFATDKPINEINCSHNKIKKISIKNVAKKDGVKILNLSYNELSEINFEDFSGGMQIDELNLSHNQITKCHLDGLSNNRGMSLDLSRNQINEFSCKNNSSEIAFKLINLSHNQMKEINLDAFSNVSIHELDLSHNNLQRLIISKNTQLRINRLNLSCNNDLKIDNGGLANIIVFEKFSPPTGMQEIKRDIIGGLLANICANELIQCSIIKKQDHILIYKNLLIDMYIGTALRNMLGYPADYNSFLAINLCRDFCVELFLCLNLNEEVGNPNDYLKSLLADINSGMIPFTKIYPARSLKWICGWLDKHRISILPFLARNRQYITHVNEQEYLEIIDECQLFYPLADKKLLDDIKAQFRAKFVNDDYNGRILGFLNKFEPDIAHMAELAKAIAHCRYIKIFKENGISDAELNFYMQQVTKSNPYTYYQFNENDLAHYISRITIHDAKKILDKTLTIDIRKIVSEFEDTLYAIIGATNSPTDNLQLVYVKSWNDILRNAKTFQNKKLITDIEQLNASPKVNSAIILACTPLLTLNNIKNIIKRGQITPACKACLEDLVKCAKYFYGTSKEFTDDEPIKLLAIARKPSQPQQFLVIDLLNRDRTKFPDSIFLITLIDERWVNVKKLRLDSFMQIKPQLAKWIARDIEAEINSYCKNLSTS